MVSIGIGITTYNRPECLEECLKNIYKHTFTNNVKIYVATDTDEDRRGVAFRKNECLRSLKNCDHIFLFDDDCYPIKDGWIEFFIRKSQGEHVLFLNDKLHNHIVTMSNIRCYNDCGGVFMYITKEHLNKVGAFNEKFEGYGFEHCDWSIRCNDNKKVFYMIQGTEEYLFAHDYSTANHKSSITDEEKQIHIKNNWDKFFDCKIENIYIPL